MISSLSQRVIRGYIQLQLVLVILLFLPAGSIRFWEAWLYYGLFGGSILFITWYFLKVDLDFVERRMQIGPGAEPSKTQQVVQFMAGVLACVLFLAAGFEHRLRGSDLPASVVLVADGLLLFCMGITFRVFHANRYAAGTVRVEVNQQVVSNGPYAIVRHPLYVASILGFMATPFALGSLWALPFGLLLCAVVVVRLLDEERFLLEHLAGYADYCRHVRYRLIPFLW
jgi:protein-S-isoprenylcysteine O-methyltransferase Ste14